MKIHFEGTKKELFRQLLSYYCHLDWVVLEVSEIKKIAGLKSVYCFDMAVESRIPYKDDIDDCESFKREFILDQLYGYDVPISQYDIYKEAFFKLSSYIESGEQKKFKDIINILKECYEYISNNEEKIKYYETHRSLKLY